MAARVIDGKAVAAAVRERVKVDVAAYEAESGRTPQLVTILVGNDPASEIYIRGKHKASGEAGIRSAHHGLDAATRSAARPVPAASVRGPGPARPGRQPGKLRRAAGGRLSGE